MHPQQRQEQVEQLKTGTTTVGVRTDDAVVFAADKRATMGYLKASNKAQKVFQIDDALGVTIAGSVGDAQQLIRIMRAQLKLYKLETGELSVKGAATLLSNILHANRYYPYFNQFLIGGFTGESPTMYDLDPLGGAMEQTDFTATGSGSPMAYGLFEDAYESGMDEDEAVSLVIRAVRAASERDVASGDGVDVAVINTDGFRRLEPEEVEKHF